MNYLFEIDDGEQTWISAESRDEALRMYLEQLVGEVPEDMSKVDQRQFNCPFDEITVKQLDNDLIVPVRIEDTDEVEKKTAEEWAREGKSFVACSCY